MKKIDNNEFRIRAYGRTELAQLYAPGLTPQSAYRRLRQWIDYCPGLNERLNAMSTNTKSRIWTAPQVAQIIEALGEP